MRWLFAAVHWVGNKFRLMTRMRITSFFLGLYSLGSFLTVTIDPILKDSKYNIFRREDFFNIFINYWYIILAALYLKYKDPVERKMQADKKRRLSWKTRKLTSALAIQRLELKASNTEIKEFRREILLCIASSVAET